MVFFFGFCTYNESKRLKGKRMLLLSEFLCLLASLIGPVIAVFVYCIMVPKGWKWILFGAVCYVITEMMIRLPLLTLLNSDASIGPYLSANPYLNAALMAASAALLGIGSRWLVVRFILGWDDTNKIALGFGLGFGAIEAALVSGIDWLLIVFSNPQPAVLGASPLTPLWSGMERLSILLFQIVWTILIFKSIRDKKPSLFWICLTANFLVVFGATCAVSIWNMPVWILEVILLVPALWFGYSIAYKSIKSE